MKFTMQTMDMCKKNLKLRGEVEKYTIKPYRKQIHLELRRGTLDITYYTVPLLSTMEENWGSHEIQIQ
jgi:hypothetical protein